MYITCAPVTKQSSDYIIITKSLVGIHMYARKQNYNTQGLLRDNAFSLLPMHAS